MVEDATEVEPEGDEELIPDDGDGNANGPNLEEVLQCEAEVLAAEIQELEESGEFDTAVLEELEAGVEQAAESLVTMREARSRINEIKRDRGFGRAPAGSKPKLNGNQVEKKKTKTQCWDCGEFGHWGGDPQCPKPGAGLHKPKQAGKRPAVQKHVKVVESLNTEHVLDEPPVSNEINMVHHDSMRFEEALESSKQEDKPVPGLSRDKVLMGALDSACNRTCAGEVWIQHFLLTLQHAPPEVQAIVATAEENELFRFGNGGTQRSSVRYRLPVMVGNNLLAVWVSVVKVPSLGLLLGRDFLDGIGAVISFTKQKLRPDFLDGKLISLSQVAAGHFALSLVPSTWPRLGGLRWRRWGPDGILEQQITSQAWLSRKLNMSKQFEKHGGSHEHLVTEQGFNAAHLAVLTFPLPGPSVQAMSLKTQPSRSTTSPTSSEVGVPTSTSPVTSPTTSHGPSTKGQSKLRKPMVSNGTPAGHSRSMARIWAALMAGAAACNQILAVPLSGNNQSGAVGATNQGHGAGQVLDEETWRKGPKLGALLNLDLNDQMKVEQIKEAIKPMLATLKGVATSSSSSDAVDAKAKVAAKRGAKPKTQSAPPPRPLADHPAEPSLSSANTTAEIQAMLAQQELRFQSMMNQMMQHMVSLQQVPAAAIPRDFTDEEMREINAAYADQLEEEQLWAVHGEEMEWMTPAERADAVDHLS